MYVPPEHPCSLSVPHHCPTPLYATPRDLRFRTRGREVVEVARLLGVEPMCWQRRVADVIFEVDESGLPRYREVVVSVCRQCGKTFFVLCLIVHRLLFWDPGVRQNISYSAQSVIDSMAVWESELWPVLSDSGFVGEFSLRFLRGMQAPGIRSPHGRVRLETSSAKAGHGQTLSFVVLDEAMAYPDERKEQSLVPTMRTKPDAQFLVFSTAGDDNSAYLLRKVEEGRRRCVAGESSRSAFFEWGLDPSADWRDESLWPDAVPGLGVTVTIEDLRHEMDVMEEAEFRRAALNQWRILAAGSYRLFPAEVWGVVCSDRLRVPDSGTVHVGLSASQDRSSASLAVAAGGVVEIMRSSPGVDWVPGAVRRLVDGFGDRLAGVWHEKNGVLADVVSDLAGDGLPVEKRDAAPACARFYGDVMGRVVSLWPSSALRRSLHVTRARTRGAGMTFGPTVFGAETDPLVAAALAWDAGRSNDRVNSGLGFGSWDDDDDDEYQAWLADYLAST